MHFAADALYLKDWRLDQNLNGSRLMFSALAFGQTEFASKVKDRLTIRDSEQSGSSWHKFVDRFIELTASTYTARTTFNDVYSIEKSLGRFDENYVPPPRLNPMVEGIFRIWRWLPVAYRAKIVRVLHLSKGFIRKVRYLMSRPSDIEHLFSEVGLDNVAKELKKSRLR